MSFLIENGILKKYINDDNATDVIIPDGVVRIGEQAFQGADNIVSVTVPEGVKLIGTSAFCKCANLTTVILPESIIRIGECAFSHCFNLAEINTLGKITRINTATFYFCKCLTSITIPDGVTYIGENAFSHCEHLTSVKLPDSLEIIDCMAFGSCDNLADFSIPANVKKIGYYSFVGCKKLYKITLPDNLRIIDGGVFASCEGLAEIIIPDGVESIKNSAFNSCVNLSEVTIPSSVTQIEAFAFSGCRNLHKVTVSNKDTEIMFNAFFQCENMVTNFLIIEWNRIWGIERFEYTLHYMRNFKAGDPFYEATKEKNKRYIRHQLFNILEKKNPNDIFYSGNDPCAIRPDDTDVIIFLTDEIPLRIDEVESLLDKVQGNPEAAAILLDYRTKNFTEEFLADYKNDKLQKELGLKERSVADWKNIFRIGDDGNGGYIILGYKGKDLSFEIPKKIGKRSVTAIDDLAFSPKALYITEEMRSIRKSLETVIIPDSVTSIGHSAFSDCAQSCSIVYRGKTFTLDEFEEYCRSNIPR